MKKKLQHNAQEAMDLQMTNTKNNCTACGAERKKKGIAYHPFTFDPYCSNPYICNEKHPNSPQELIKRGEQLDLIDSDNVAQKYAEFLSLTHSPQHAERIRKMISQPITVRISQSSVAGALVQMQESLGLSNISETIRHCIQIAIDINQNFEQKKEVLQEEKTKTDTIKKVEETLTETEDEGMVF